MTDKNAPPVVAVLPVTPPAAPETPIPPATRHPSFYIPAKWEITSSPDGIRAYNPDTNDTFEGPVDEFNAMLK